MFTLAVAATAGRVLVDGAGLRSLVAAVLDVPAASVDADTGPASEGNWTSLRHLQIVTAVQREYGVSLTPRQIRSVRCVGDLQDIIAGAGARR